MRAEEFDYFLPDELIAQYPLPRRDASRLMVLRRGSGRLEHRVFTQILEYLEPGDLVVFNDTKVIPARLAGRKVTGGRVELLVVRRDTMEREGEVWRCMVRPSKGIGEGTRVVFGDDFEARALGRCGEGLWRFLLCGKDVGGMISKYGKVPLPPYIRREAVEIDSGRYQTVFARNEGAVAAPTAGLHFTEDILREMEDMGVEIRYLTLHTGPATFLPVRDGEVSEHRVPEEHYMVPEATASAVSAAKKEGRRVVAVGSTVTRTLEACFMDGLGRPRLSGGTDLFIRPGFRFRVVDALVTNFHLPRSSLVMLVAAFAGREAVLAAYREAVRRRYRFFSYGDCMLIV